MLSQLAGNPKLKEQLSARLSGGQLSHAYILSGPEGSGKHTLAAILTAAMVCSGSGARPCGGCPGCKKARAGIHPDIITLAPEEGKKDFTVDQVRRLRADAWVRPNEAPRKVYVLEQAERLNPSAQNAMLKLLEEGPAYAAFLLLTENAGALLTTVRSRCEELALAPVSVPQAEQWLTQRFPQCSPQQCRQAALDCQGVLGRAVARLSGADEQDAAVALQAQQLIRAWLNREELALMELCVPLEKWDRQQMTDLLDRMTALLSAQLAQAEDRRRVLELIQLTAQLRQAAALNVNPGHLAGWLCVSACAE